MYKQEEKVRCLRNLSRNIPTCPAHVLPLSRLSFTIHHHPNTHCFRSESGSFVSWSSHKQDHLFTFTMKPWYLVFSFKCKIYQSGNKLRHTQGLDYWLQYYTIMYTMCLIRWNICICVLKYCQWQRQCNTSREMIIDICSKMSVLGHFEEVRNIYLWWGSLSV